MSTITISIDNYNFSATLFDNPVATEIQALLPFEITMQDLNNNEKYYNFSQTFSAKPKNINNIHKGDIMLYQDNCLVIFYDDFETNIQYTPIGKVDDINKIEMFSHQQEIKVAFTL
ncbi:cyclophilin-like fold protein [Staphylococcus pettenkoferi]|uniref:cyclophilin-like fold protein n=2 Tax=Staphylococcus pettenkoferi TaxID=170573 RepID=UPI00066DA99A|nr:cyclophilin-like fold protein [Staphylococcus pettenkoferi]MCY1585462.1 cyclophilin-like fold protein [Staphylococcus pettenkoferi]MCY1627016.1 cyclophilin-like fold protein [Staphylococcus pettenkoferi]QQC36393.1 hypothetical protein I6I28_06420 [Staphylococcus pettenkoferi]UIK46984.1 hypothetical protein LFM57_06450 [Staphylococcus pettenkoferi]